MLGHFRNGLTLVFSRIKLTVVYHQQVIAFYVLITLMKTRFIGPMI